MPTTAPQQVVEQLRDTPAPSAQLEPSPPARVPEPSRSEPQNLNIARPQTARPQTSAPPVVEILSDGPGLRAAITRAVLQNVGYIPLYIRFT